MAYNSSMEIKIVEPSGFCFGVKKAIEIAKKAKRENEGKPIYIIGSLVHNEDVVKKLESDGFIILDERKKSLDTYLYELEEGSVIVFSAHGHAPFLDEIATKKNLKIYDATCVFVKNNENVATNWIKKDNEVIYIGIAKHAETIGIIGVDEKKIHLYQPGVPFDYEKVKSITPLIISQTTMAEEEITSSIKDLLEHFPNAVVSARQCFETERRQSGAIKYGKDYDCFIVIGGKNSNNTKRLVFVLENSYPNKKCIWVLNEKELEHEIPAIKAYDKIMLVSGASTSDATISACYNLISSNIK